MTDTEITAAVAERQAVEADAEADRVFGATMREMVDAAHGEHAGRRLRDAICQPTKPGTPARERQDKAWSLLSSRLSKLAGAA